MRASVGHRLAGEVEGLVEEDPVVGGEAEVEPVPGLALRQAQGERVHSRPLVLTPPGLALRQAQGERVRSRPLVVSSPDRLLEGADGEAGGPLHPLRLLLPGRDGEDGLGGAEPDPTGAEGLAEEGAGGELPAEPGEVHGGAASDVEDLAGVVVEVAAEGGEPVSLAEGVEPLGEGDVEDAAGAGGEGEEGIEVAHVEEPLAEGPAELGGGEGGEVEPGWGVAAEGVGDGIGGRGGRRLRTRRSEREHERRPRALRAGVGHAIHREEDRTGV